MPAVHLFTDEEMAHLEELQAEFSQHVSEMTENEYRKEMERLGIDLSWKSSQIEGNTYSLLETERLLRESKTADGKTKEEAVMLLNHKDALRFDEIAPYIKKYRSNKDIALFKSHYDMLQQIEPKKKQNSKNEIVISIWPEGNTKDNQSHYLRATWKI